MCGEFESQLNMRYVSADTSADDALPDLTA